MAMVFGLTSQLSTMKICEAFVCWDLFKETVLAQPKFCMLLYVQQWHLATFHLIKAFCLCLPLFVFKVHVSPVRAQQWVSCRDVGPSLNPETRLTKAIKASDSMPACD